MPRSVYIGNNVKFNHRGLGTVISNRATISDDVWIEHHVTLGMRMNGDVNDGAPIIEKGVFIGAYSIILGPITIGENSIIGAGTIVLKDVPPNTKVVGNVNNRIIKRD